MCMVTGLPEGVRGVLLWGALESGSLVTPTLWRGGQGSNESADPLRKYMTTVVSPH